jgi:hypothetical protein
MPIDLMVLAKGFEPRSVPGVTGDTQVRLVPLRQVTVRLVGGPPILPEGHSLFAEQRSTGRIGGRRFLLDGASGDVASYPAPTRAEFDAEGGAAFHVGSGTVTLRIMLRDDATGTAVDVQGTSPRQVEAPAEGSEIQLTIPAGALEDALRRLHGQ